MYLFLNCFIYFLYLTFIFLNLKNNSKIENQIDLLKISMKEQENVILVERKENVKLKSEINRFELIIDDLTKNLFENEKINEDKKNHSKNLEKIIFEIETEIKMLNSQNNNLNNILENSQNEILVKNQLIEDLKKENEQNFQKTLKEHNARFEDIKNTNKCLYQENQTLKEYKKEYEQNELKLKKHKFLKKIIHFLFNQFKFQKN